MLNARGVTVVVVTNQSGIAQGKFAISDYESVRERVDRSLAMHNARIDASYYCPHHPDFTGACDCRKPGRLLFDRAIEDLGLDGSSSMFAGDRMRDVLPALSFAGKGFLIRAPSTPPEELTQAADAQFEVVDSLLQAVQRFLGDLFPASLRSP